MIKAIFFDVDGTLVPFGEKNMPQSCLNALNLLRANGVKLFVATGRHPGMLASLHKTFTFDGYVTLNGQYAWLGAEVLHSQPLNKSDVAQFVSELDKLGFACIFLELKGGYANFINDKVKLFAQVHDLPVPVVAPVERALQNDVYQVVCFANKEEEAQLSSVVTGPDYSRWSPLFVDIVPKDGGKVAGIEQILSKLGISPQEVMAFGDGENDVEMLQYAGVGIAMGNGTKEAFQASDYITSSVEENGVYNALIQYKLLES